MSHPLHTYFRAARDELLASYRKVADVRHSGTKGSGREVFLNTFLKKAFPAKYVIAGGEIFDRNGVISPQVDIAIYDEAFPAFDIGTGNQYMAEGVFAHLEVKSTLDKDELRKALDNVRAVKSLELKVDAFMTHGNLRKDIPSFVFAYEGWKDPQSFKDAMLDLCPDSGDPKRVPNGIFVLDPGYGYVSNDKGQDFFNSGDHILAVAFVILHQHMFKNWAGATNWEGYASALKMTDI